MNKEKAILPFLKIFSHLDDGVEMSARIAATKFRAAGQHLGSDATHILGNPKLYNVDKRTGELLINNQNYKLISLHLANGKLSKAFEMINPKLKSSLKSDKVVYKELKNQLKQWPTYNLNKIIINSKRLENAHPYLKTIQNGDEAIKAFKSRGLFSKIINFISDCKKPIAYTALVTGSLTAGFIQLEKTRKQLSGCYRYTQEGNRVTSCKIAEMTCDPQFKTTNSNYCQKNTIPIVKEPCIENDKRVCAGCSNKEVFRELDNEFENKNPNNTVTYVCRTPSITEVLGDLFHHKFDDFINFINDAIKSIFKPAYFYIKVVVIFILTFISLVISLFTFKLFIGSQEDIEQPLIEHQKSREEK